MFSTKLKYRYIQKKMDKLFDKRAERKLVDNKKIQTVGLLTLDDESNIFQLQELVTEKLSLRNPKIYSYRKYDKNDEKSYKHFTEKDFDWKGNIIDSSLKSFVEQPFDLLICFYQLNNSYLEYITLLSEASFKVGLAGINQALFDMEIAMDNYKSEDYLEEIHKYLTILNKLE